MIPEIVSDELEQASSSSTGIVDTVIANVFLLVLCLAISLVLFPFLGMEFRALVTYAIQNWHEWRRLPAMMRERYEMEKKQRRLEWHDSDDDDDDDGVEDEDEDSSIERKELVGSKGQEDVDSENTDAKDLKTDSTLASLMNKDANNNNSSIVARIDAVDMASDRDPKNMVSQATQCSDIDFEVLEMRTQLPLRFKNGRSSPYLSIRTRGGNKLGTKVYKHNLGMPVSPQDADILPTLTPEDPEHWLPESSALRLQKHARSRSAGRNLFMQGLDLPELPAISLPRISVSRARAKSDSGAPLSTSVQSPKIIAHTPKVVEEDPLENGQHDVEKSVQRQKKEEEEDHEHHEIENGESNQEQATEQQVAAVEDEDKKSAMKIHDSDVDHLQQNAISSANVVPIDETSFSVRVWQRESESMDLDSSAQIMTQRYMEQYVMQYGFYVPHGFTSIGRKQLTNQKEVNCNMSCSWLTRVPLDMLDATHLTQLDLSGNYLTTLPEWFFDSMKSLTFLDLSRNYFTDLPQKMSDLKKLKELHMGHNRLEYFPSAAIFGLPVLQLLDVSHNMLVAIPNEIVKLSNSLVELNFSNNFIVTLPQELRSLRRLKYLNGSENPLTLASKSTILKKFHVESRRTRRNRDKRLSASIPAPVVPAMQVPLESTPLVAAAPVTSTPSSSSSSSSTSPSLLNLNAAEAPSSPPSASSLPSTQTSTTAATPSSSFSGLAVARNGSLQRIVSPRSAESTGFNREVKGAAENLSGDEQVEEEGAVDIAETIDVADEDGIDEEGMDDEEELSYFQIRKKPLRTRSFLVAELLESERRFVQHMNVLFHMYFLPMKTQLQDIQEEFHFSLTDEDIDQILPNEISAVITVHRTFLVDLQSRLQVDEYNLTLLEHVTFADVFRERVSLFEHVHTAYIPVFSRAIERLQNLRKQSSEFDKFLLARRKLPICGGMDLDTFLMLPLHRLRTYMHYLKLIAWTNYDDRSDLESLLGELDKAWHKQKAHLFFLDNDFRVSELRKKFRSKTLPPPGAVLIREGRLILAPSRALQLIKKDFQKHVKKNSNSYIDMVKNINITMDDVKKFKLEDVPYFKDLSFRDMRLTELSVNLYLFKDCMIYMENNILKKLVGKIHRFDLHDAEVEKSEESNKEFIVKLRDKKRYFAFICNSAQEMMDWYEDFSAVICELQRTDSSEGTEMDDITAPFVLDLGSMMKRHEQKMTEYDERIEGGDFDDLEEHGTFDDFDDDGDDDDSGEYEDDDMFFHADSDEDEDYSSGQSHFGTQKANRSALTERFDIISDDSPVMLSSLTAAERRRHTRTLSSGESFPMGAIAAADTVTGEANDQESNRHSVAIPSRRRGWSLRR